MHLIAIINNLRFQDALDVVFLTVIVYHLYLWFRGTKAFKALVGLLVLGVVFTIARTWGLFLTTWVFQILWQVLVILLIILFQSEIRQVLERVNPLRSLGLHKHALRGKWIQEISRVVFSLAAKRVGALIIVEQADRVEELVTGGQSLDAEPGPELLMSIFQKESPLHDGAVVIREDRISRVGCYLPLSSSEGLPKEWGTRHRAAVGLTERCDALVMVVSEERGQVSLAQAAKLRQVEGPEELARLLMEAVAPTAQKTGWWEKTMSLVIRRWPAKLGTLALVAVLWLLLAGQQDFEVTVRVPLKFRNLPATTEILEPVNPRVRIRVRGLRKDASTLNERNVLAEVDLSPAGTGRSTFPITRDQISLPNDRVHVVNIEPSHITFRFRDRP